jgi:hypothetical protein
MQEEGTSDARGVVSALTSAGSILIFDLLRNSYYMLSPLGTMCCASGRCCACYVCICACKRKCTRTLTNVCRRSIRSECKAWRRGSCSTSVGGQLQQCWVELSLCAAICFLVMKKQKRSTRDEGFMGINSTVGGWSLWWGGEACRGLKKNDADGKNTKKNSK